MIELYVTKKAVLGMHLELQCRPAVLTIKGRARVRKNERGRERFCHEEKGGQNEKAIRYNLELIYVVPHRT